MEILYSIKDLEKFSGIKAHTIRIWEQRYGLLSPKRTETNIRKYPADELKNLLNISFLNAQGHKISKLAQLSREDLKNLVHSKWDEPEDFGGLVNSLVTSMIDLDETLFDKIFAHSVLNRGFEGTFIQVIIPFLQKIGLLWQTSEICPTQEHFISNLIRQKVIAAIDGQPLRKRENGKSIIVFLPEGEYHEISLLIANFLFRKHGHQTWYLGQNLPYSMLKTALDKLSPDYLYTHLSSGQTEGEISRFFGKILSTYEDLELLVVNTCGEELPENENLVLFETPDGLIKFIKELE